VLDELIVRLPISSTSRVRQIATSALLLVALTTANSASLFGPNLVTALRAGGYVILMRHASSPGQPPDSTHAAAENIQQERQLDDLGRASAQAMGEALRRLRIPIGAVLSSPTYRALETVKLAQLGEPILFAELGDSGQGGTGPDSERARWLRAEIAMPPGAQRNTVIVTHYPNIIEACPGRADGLAEGEALILYPDAKGSAHLVARVKIDDWARLVGAH
jgi:phosphohistidine phosphatase SixA